jgi:tripartite-type tricarboxylate transporter receptor subunit TctC
MQRSRFHIFKSIQFLSIALAVFSASAQDYPNRPVRVVIPFAPGGSNDIVGRFISDQLSKRLGAPFVVDNRGGAGGTMGTDMVAKAKPDGYTLLLISTPHTANSTLYKKLAYNPVKDFVPIARLGTAQQVISVFPGLPVKTLPEFIAYAKARPGQLNYVSSGVGSSQHLVTEMFTNLAGIKLIHVPYKGAGAALADVAAGHAQLSIGTVTQALPLLRGERMRPLAVSGAKRQPVVPDVPTASEVGLNGFDADNWWGFLAPAGTPPEIVQKLSTVLADILSKPETIKKLAEESATVGYMPSDAFAKFMETETIKWAQLIQQLKLQAE